MPGSAASDVTPPTVAPVQPAAAAPPVPATNIAEELARRLPLLFDRLASTTAAEPRLPAIPPILLEGDRPGLTAKAPVTPPASAREIHSGNEAPLRFVPPLPEEVTVGAPTEGFVPAAPSVIQPVEPPTPPATTSGPTDVSFPHTGSLWLTARDPFCVVAHWQIPAGALTAYARAHRGGSWRLRVHLDSVAGPLVQEQDLPAHADHRFVPVFQPGARYVAELGFRFADGGWRGLVLSSPTFTPTDAPTTFFAEAEVSRAPVGPITPDLLAQLPPDHPEPVPVPSYTMSAPGAAAASAGAAALPTPRQAQWLTELVWEPVVRPPEAPSSAEVVEWQAREVSRLTADAAAAALPPGPPSSADLASSGAGLSAESSPSSDAMPTVPKPPTDFWFKVNAELIIYGSTERDARVTIAGRPVALRADGSFSFRFALPDGDFSLPAIAINAAGTDGRAARLRFTRATVLTGEVGVHPQDVRLKPPVAEAIV